MSSFSVLYGISNINSAMGMAELSRVLGIAGFGMANAYALFGVLSFVFAVRSCSGNHPARNKVIKIHDANGPVSDCSCLVFLQY